MKWENLFLSIDGGDWLSSGIALLAFLVSIGSYRIAHRSLKLHEEEKQRKEPKLIIYKIDNFYKTIKGSRFYVFSVTINNPAASGNTITGCELRITYQRFDETFGNLILPHDKNLMDSLDIAGVNSISFPCPIESHGAVTGAVIFKLDKELIEKLSPKDYEVILRDSHSLETKMHASLISDIQDA